MKTWFTSDTHLGHARIIELCNRPFSDVTQMDRQLIDSINDTVPETDRLVMLGDNIMGNWANGLELVARIRAAEVVFLPGNHDKWSLIYGSEVKRFSNAGDLQKARENFRVALEDENWAKKRSWSFAELAPEQPKDHPLQAAVFSHFPYTGESWDGREDRYKDMRPLGDAPVVCGHVHDSWAEKDKQYNAGVDVRGYKPVPEEEVIVWMEQL